jgi:hypothetical protein
LPPLLDELPGPALVPPLLDVDPPPPPPTPLDELPLLLLDADPPPLPPLPLLDELEELLDELEELLDPVHTPDAQVPVEHAVPSGFAGFEHCPVAGSHVPASWHSSGALQVTAPPPVQMPAWHVSPCVQALPSSHAVPSVVLETVHVPVAASQAETVVHCVGAGQVTGDPPTHAPAWQVSVCVQASPSSQDVPFGAAGLVHMPVAELHVPAVWH